MKDFITRLTGTFAMVLLGLSQSSGQQALDLEAALQHALAHHSSVQTAKLEIQKGKELIRESMSTGLPQLSANGSLVNNPAIRTSLVPAEFFGGSAGEFVPVTFGTKWYGSAGVQLDQMIFNKQWLLAMEATRELQDFYQYNVERSEEEVVYEVAKLYFQIQLTNTQRDILQANLDQINGLLRVTELQFENGFAKKIDVDRLRVQQANLQTELDNLDLQVGQLMDALKFSMQMPFETAIVLTDSITESSLPSIDPFLAQPTFANRPVLKILQKEIELNGLDERRYKAGYFPTLNFFANYNYEWQANQFSDFGDGQKWFDYSQVGLSLNVPIFDGFYKKAKRQTAILNGMQKQQELSLVKLSYQLQHQTAVTSLQVNQNKLNSVKATVDTAEEVYRVTQQRYREGVAPITELLNAETALRESQTNYLTTLGQIKLAEIDLLHANGQLVGLAK